MAHTMRRVLVVGVGAAAAVMMVASAAFACTNFMGEIKVNYNGSGASGSTTAHGWKAHGSMVYCNHDGNRANLGTNIATGSNTGGNTVTVTVQPYTCTAPQGQTTQIGADSNYNIYGTAGQWDDTATIGNTDCMGLSTATKLGGPYTVTSSTSPQTFTSNAWSPGPGVGNTVVCFDVTLSQKIDSAPEANTTMV